MSNLPLVSIITPSFNQGRFLDECMASVLGQDYPNLEYIVMDGGSTDGSLDIIRKYDGRLAYWVSEADAGQTAAINAGLARASGEIWAWMNADDAYLPTAVSRAVAWLDAHPQQDIVYGDCMVVGDIRAAGVAVRRLHAGHIDLAQMLMGKIGIPSGSTFLRARVREQIGNLDDELHYLMDNDYWLRAAQVCSFGYLPETLSIYRVYPAAKTWDVAQNVKRAREFALVYERFWRQADLPGSILRLRARSLVSVYLYAAQLASQANERALCWFYVRKSLAQGLTALQPGLLRQVAYLVFGFKAPRKAL